VKRYIEFFIGGMFGLSHKDERYNAAHDDKTAQVNLRD